MRHLQILWREALRPWWLAVSAAFAILANLDTLAGWAGIGERVGVRTLIPKLQAGTWWALWLLATVAILLHSIYRLAQSRDAARAVVERRLRNQELSDLLNDKHEYGIHELLNRPPQTSAGFEAWVKADDQWLKDVLSIMQEYGCTKQQIRHVNTLGLIQMIPLHAEGPISIRLSMLATRLSRIAEIAREYGE